MVVADGDVSLSSSINKLLAMALPPGPLHTNILKDDAPKLLMDRVSDDFDVIKNNLFNIRKYCMIRLLIVMYFMSNTNCDAGYGSRTLLIERINLQRNLLFSCIIIEQELPDTLWQQNRPAQHAFL